MSTANKWSRPCQSIPQLPSRPDTHPSVILTRPSLRRLPSTGHTAPVTSTAFSPPSTSSSPILVSGSSDRTIRLWDVSSGVLVHSIASSLGEISSVDVDQKGQNLLVSSKDNSNMVFDMRVVSPSTLSSSCARRLSRTDPPLLLFLQSCHAPSTASARTKTRQRPISALRFSPRPRTSLSAAPRTGSSTSGRSTIPTRTSRSRRSRDTRAGQCTRRYGTRGWGCWRAVGRIGQ